MKCNLWKYYKYSKNFIHETLCNDLYVFILFNVFFFQF